jgi:hypothetical protein
MEHTKQKAMSQWFHSQVHGHYGCQSALMTLGTECRLAAEDSNLQLTALLKIL